MKSVLPAISPPLNSKNICIYIYLENWSVNTNCGKGKCMLHNSLTPTGFCSPVIQQHVNMQSERFSVYLREWVVAMAGLWSPNFLPGFSHLSVVFILKCYTVGWGRAARRGREQTAWGDPQRVNTLRSWMNLFLFNFYFILEYSWNPWIEESGRLRSQGSQQSDTSQQPSTHTSCYTVWRMNLLFCPQKGCSLVFLSSFLSFFPAFFLVGWLEFLVIPHEVNKPSSRKWKSQRINAQEIPSLTGSLPCTSSTVMWRHIMASEHILHFALVGLSVSPSDSGWNPDSQRWWW